MIQRPPILGAGTLLCFSFSEIHFFQERIKPFIHLSWSKAGTFTKKAHVCFEHLKMQDFPQIIYALLNPYLKTAPNKSDPDPQ